MGTVKSSSEEQVFSWGPGQGVQMSAKKNRVLKGMGGEMGKLRGGPPGGRWSLQGEQVFIKWPG